MNTYPIRHNDTKRNRIINNTITDLNTIINNHDPDIHTNINNSVWDRLDQMSLEIEEHAYQQEYRNGFDDGCAHMKEDYSTGERIQPKPGYHITHIEKGEVGEITKIKEEVLELEDAHKQGSKVMEAVELSDLYGAIESYLPKLGLTMDDLKRMSDITKRVFKNGYR